VWLVGVLTGPRGGGVRGGHVLPRQVHERSKVLERLRQLESSGKAGSRRRPQRRVSERNGLASANGGLGGGIAAVNLQEVIDALPRRWNCSYYRFFPDKKPERKMSIDVGKTPDGKIMVEVGKAKQPERPGSKPSAKPSSKPSVSKPSSSPVKPCPADPPNHAGGGGGGAPLKALDMASAEAISALLANQVSQTD
jgi:hypothetical protein